MRDFDGARVCSIQGDYANMQCLAPCRQEVWPSRPDVERLVAVTDPVTQQITDPQVFPRCRFCGGNVFLNVCLPNTSYALTPLNLRAWNDRLGSPCRLC